MNLLGAIHAYSKGELADDVTMLCLKYLGPRAPAPRDPDYTSSSSPS